MSTSSNFGTPPSRRPKSAVIGLPTGQDADDRDSFLRAVDEQNAPFTDAQPPLRRIKTLQANHVSVVALCESVDPFQNSRPVLLIETLEVPPGGT